MLIKSSQKSLCLLQLKLLKPGRILFWIATFLLCFNSAALAAAEKPKPEEPKVNPLEIIAPDPLLPQQQKKRSLSQEEQLRLRGALEQLNAQAAQLLQADKAPEAFEIWYRELRLRRALGYVEEVQALGRVGEIAWQRTQKSDAQVISRRLQEIQKEAQDKKVMNLELLQALGTAYQQVRLLEPAVGVYEKLLDDARIRQDAATQEATLKTLAELNLAWFDYPKAAKAYEELLAQARANGDNVNAVAYLQQLLYIYDKAKQPANALKTKEQLMETYLNQKDFTKIPALKIAIGSDYEALAQASQKSQEAMVQLEKASQSYQEAYSLAWSSKQFAYASEALKKLGALYHSQNQPEDALRAYEVLIKSEQQAFNFYGLMNAYDKIGQIYMEQKKYAQALEVFQKGLELAKTLNYQESYFVNQIQRVTTQTSR